MGNYTVALDVLKVPLLVHTTSMRILIATGLYAPEIGGPATYTAFLEAHLPKHGMTFEVLPFSSVRAYPRFIRHLVYIIKLIRRARSFDTLYALDTVSVGVPVMCASILTRIPYLLRVPGDYAWEQGQVRFGITETLDVYASHTQHPWPVRLLAWLQSVVARRAKKVVVPSEYLKDIVAAWGVPRTRITRIYSELKEIRVTEERGELRKRFGYGDFVVTTAGRLTPWKGTRAVIAVIHALRMEGLPVSLEVIGDGVCYEDLRSYVRTLDAGDYVRLLGSLNRDEMARRIKASDAFVLNTAYEGLSHQLIEVMHLGTPIITTHVGGNLELITNHDSGLLVPYGDERAISDALRRFINDHAYAAMLASHAYEQTHRFREDIIIREFLAFLDVTSEQVLQ